MIKRDGLRTEITLKNAEAKSSELHCRTTDGAAKFILYEIYPGIFFVFNDVQASVLPKMTAYEADDCICTINYAASGTCGLYSSNGKYIYLRAGKLMLSSEQAEHSFEYPVGSYFGIEICIMRRALESKEFLSFFDIDIEQMLHICLQNSHTTVIVENVNLFKNTIDDVMTLWQNEALDLSLLRLHALYILRMLTAGAAELRLGYEGALSKCQMDMAKKTEQLLTSDLASRRTIADIARSLDISATSLKNYFRTVYGQNISEYLKGKRIDEAKRLLKETNLSILEIANRVGFESQSKFTAMFHASLGLTPTEFRRSSNE